VRRAREGPLEDLPRRPKRDPRRTRREFKGLIVAEAKGTGYRYLKFPVVLIETLPREVDLHLLTFPFHLKSGTNVFTPYPVPRDGRLMKVDRLSERKIKGRRAEGWQKEEGSMRPSVRRSRR